MFARMFSSFRNFVNRQYQFIID